MLNIIKLQFKFIKKLFKVFLVQEKVANFLRYAAYYLSMHWHRRGKSWLAIEITSVEIKLMMMSKSLERYCVDYYSVVSLPANVVNSNEIRFRENIKLALQRILQRTKQKASFVITAMPSSMTIHKKISLEKTDDSLVLDSLVEQSLSKYIPYRSEDLSVDYVVLGTNKLNATKQDVLLVASQCKYVAERVEAIEAAGLTVKILDIDSYAVGRALALIAHQIPKDLVEKSIIACIDIGAKLTKFNVFHAGIVLYAHEEAFGGDFLTQAIMHRYGLSYEQAKLAKHTDVLPADYYEELAQSFKKSTVQQVLQLLKMFYSSATYQQVDFLILAGGGALLPDLRNLLQQELNISVIIADPCMNIDFSSSVNRDLLKANSPALMTILGLAMRGIKK